MSRSLPMLLVVLLLAALAPAAGADTFAATAPGNTNFVVPAGVDSLTVTATGAAGGNYVNGTGAVLVPGGRAARVSGRVKVFPGERLQLVVGAGGGDGISTTGAAGAGGAPDGGAGGYSAGGGGGATRILGCEGVICPVAVIAAGGGGAGASGYISLGSSFPILLGGAGGDAAARGSDGVSDSPISGGSGGQPGTAGGVGTGGPGTKAGANGNGPAGGAGGNQGPYEMHQGGGGGGGGVFGGGGGGGGNSGMDASLKQAYAGGAGGGGGSSLAPANTVLGLAAAGAAPGIVLTWVAPAGPGPGPGPGSGPGPAGGEGGPVLSRLLVSPAAFTAAPRGPSALAFAPRGPGAKVAFTLDRAGDVRFTVLQRRPGRRARAGTCAKPTPTNGSAPRCTRKVLLPGSFARTGNGPGLSRFRFSGRLRGQRLQPGKYMLLATPSAGGKTGPRVSAPFRILG